MPLSTRVSISRWTTFSWTRSRPRPSFTCGLSAPIKCSKTDPFRQGCFIYLGQGRPPLCSVAASLAYLNLRGPEPGPLFRYANGCPLSRQQLSTSLQSILRSAGVSSQYSGHSFRIGAATTAARRGIPDHLIKTLGRWSSDAYQTYIRTPVATICGAAQLMALTVVHVHRPVQDVGVQASGVEVGSPSQEPFSVPGAGPEALRPGGFSWLVFRDCQPRVDCPRFAAPNFNTRCSC